MENLNNIDLGDMDYEFESSDTSYISELTKIKRSAQSPETKLNLLDVLFKDFIFKKFHMKKNMEYSELVEFFLQKNKPQLALFCHQMIKQLYGGESINRNIVDVIIDDARETLAKEMGVEIKKEEKPGLLSSIFKSKKKEEVKKEGTVNVSKQTEKIINKALMPEGIIKVENLKEDNPEINIEKFQQEAENKLLLDMKNKNLLESNIGSDNPSIRSIDDLERIKEKIRYRKIEVAREKAEQINLERFENSS